MKWECGGTVYTTGLSPVGSFMILGVQISPLLPKIVKFTAGIQVIGKSHKLYPEGSCPSPAYSF